MEYPKYLYLDTPDQSILVQDADEEKTARSSGFRDVWGKAEEKEPDEGGDEAAELRAKLKAADIKCSPRIGIEKLRALVAEKGL